MLYLTRSPVPPLGDFVEYLWALNDAPAHGHERIVAAGTLELVVNLHEDEFRVYDPLDLGSFRRFSGAMVAGAYRAPFVIDTREHAAIVGVHFRPGGAAAFLGVPPGELADTHVDLASLWGKRAALLRERLCAAAGTEQRFEILNGALLESFSPPRERHRAVRFALGRLDQGAAVGQVCDRVGLSRRRLIEVFTADVGMTPKLFARVRRFQRAFAGARELRVPSWSELARECGYFDQSHMIRDFLAFAGTSPAEFLHARGVNVKEHHVALPDRAGSYSSNTTSNARAKISS
jgi:AraC-like DNA-binding protein